MYENYPVTLLFDTIYPIHRSSMIFYTPFQFLVQVIMKRFIQSLYFVQYNYIVLTSFRV